MKMNRSQEFKRESLGIALEKSKGKLRIVRIIWIFKNSLRGCFPTETTKSIIKYIIRMANDRRARR